MGEVAELFNKGAYKVEHRGNLAVRKCGECPLTLVGNPCYLSRRHGRSHGYP